LYLDVIKHQKILAQLTARIFILSDLIVMYNFDLIILEYRLIIFSCPARYYWNNRRYIWNISNHRHLQIFS